MNQVSAGGISTDDLGNGQTTTIRSGGKKEITEQQALAKHGLNYVIDHYLPEKLRHPERFLP